MRSILYKLYNLITGPLYRRLHLEFSLQLQDIMKANAEHHETTTKKLLDEVLRLSYVVEGGEKVSADLESPLSNTEIDAIIQDIDNSLGAVEVCHKHQLPLSTVFEIRSKFSGMNLGSIRRARQLEQEHKELSRLVETLTLENKRLLSTEHPSSL